MSLDRLSEVIDLARRRGDLDYADARWLADQRQTVRVRNGAVEKLAEAAGEGCAVRVLHGGAWGFAAVAGPPAPEGLRAALRRAAEVARAAAAVNRRRVRLADEEPQRGEYRTPVVEDPFEVPADRKIADLMRPVEILRRSPEVRAASASCLARRVRKALVTSEGTAVEQTLVHGSAGIYCVAVRGGETQVRSYPMGHDGGVGGGGYEVVRAMDLCGNAERVREEAIALLSAPPPPAGRRTIVLEPSQLALQIHESCGHATESDRALGQEISLAGSSFLAPEHLGRLRYGSTRVNLAADSSTPGGLGTAGWDDEGVPARRTPLVSRGLFVGYLSSRETAAQLGLGRSAGCMRADSWNRQPIIRMINVSLEPDPAGPPTLDAMLGDSDGAIFFATNKSWSIDDLRLNFQFACEAAWEIEGGRLGRMYKNPIYTGSTPAFWGGLERVGGPGAFRMFGFLNCGKGDPMQTMFVGHGCAPARFTGVEVRGG